MPTATPRHAIELALVVVAVVLLSTLSPRGPEPELAAPTPAEEPSALGEVPTSIADAWRVLDRELSPSSKEALRSAEDPIQFHMTLGLGLRNRWGLWGDSPIRDAVLEELPTLLHADSMSDFLIFSYMAYLEDPAVTPKQTAEDYLRER